MKKNYLIILLLCFFVLFLNGCKQEKNRYEDEKLWAFQEIDEEHEFDTFFLGPACTTGKLEAPMLDLNNEVHLSKFSGAVKMNKGIYDTNTRFFAPYYREALLCVYNLSAEEREPYLEEAYKDVKEAFEYYLKNLNNGNKIILAGFSEGADMCLRLLKDYIGNNKFYEKYVCCYAIGTAVTDEYLNNHEKLKFAEGETDLKVIISFNTEDPNTTSTLFVGENEYSYSINPLTWSRDNKVADKSLNKGAVFLNSYGEVVSTVDAFTGCYIDNKRGTLKVTDVVKEDYNSMKDLMGDGSFHLYDYQFFYENLTENVQKRIGKNYDSYKKYKVSAEEWSSLAKEYNYSLQLIENGVLTSIQRYTKDALEISGEITVLLDDKQYSLKLIEDLWVAYDTTELDMGHSGLLEAFDYDEFIFDEESRMYVCDKYENEGYIYQFKFENGYPILKLITEVSENGTEICKYEIKYSNIGTTVIEVPEYIFYDQYEAQFQRTVTEEQWNLNANEMNFTLNYFVTSNDKFETHTQKVTSEAYQLDDKIIIYKDGTKYVLEQDEDVWYATEVDNIDLFEGPLLKDLNFNNFEYNEEEKMYIQKNIEGEKFKYSIKFTDGIVTMIIIEELNNKENPLMMYYSVSDMGTTVIEVPNYIMK